MRRWVSGGLILAVLFVQLASAAYACPMQRSGTPQPSPMAGMPCADPTAAGTALDAEQPGLCLQHCQFGATQQPPPLDAVATLLAPALPTPFLFVIAPVRTAEIDGLRWLQRQRTRERTPSLAFSITHCCWRI